MAPRHPSTSASCDLGLRWHRAPWRQEGRHRGRPVPEGQAAARPGAAGLGPVAGSGWLLGRGEVAAAWGRGGVLGCREACGPAACEVILLPCRVVPFRPSEAPSLGPQAPVWSRCLARTAAPRAGLLSPREAAQRAPTRGGLPGALPGLPVPHTRAGPGRPTARATRKRQRAPSEPVRAPPPP